MLAFTAPEVDAEPGAVYAAAVEQSGVFKCLLGGPHGEPRIDAARFPALGIR